MSEDLARLAMQEWIVTGFAIAYQMQGNFDKAARYWALRQRIGYQIKVMLEATGGAKWN